MISINLLSPEKKKEVSNQMIFISLQYLISWVLIAICIAGAILSATKLYMQNAFNQAVAQSVLVTQEYGTLNQKVHLINQKIDLLAEIQNKFILWSPRLAAISELIPANITVYSMNINYITKDLQIQGYAVSREDLLLLKQNLEHSTLVKSIDLPIENLLESKDISFNIKGKISI
ncbi:MAG: PilN domain-containing protein [Patescibacteria group bacterium]